jgi:hypothetical protein
VGKPKLIVLGQASHEMEQGYQVRDSTCITQDAQQRMGMLMLRREMLMNEPDHDLVCTCCCDAVMLRWRGRGAPQCRRPATAAASRPSGSRACAGWARSRPAHSKARHENGQQQRNMQETHEKRVQASAKEPHPRLNIDF